MAIRRGNFQWGKLLLRRFKIPSRCGECKRTVLHHTERAIAAAAQQSTYCACRMAVVNNQATFWLVTTDRAPPSLCVVHPVIVRG